MTSETLKFVFDHPLILFNAIADRENEGKKEIQQFEYFESEKSFLD